MELIPISSNTLINPERISAIETRTQRGNKQHIAVVDSRNYVIEVPLKDFLQSISSVGAKAFEGHFAG